MSRSLTVVFFILVFVFIFSCKKEKPDGYYSGYPEYGEELSGGENGTVYDASSNAFGLQVAGLSTSQSLDFFVGNSFFNSNWVEAPSSTTIRDGVGPLFNSHACSGCHFKDGRGRPPAYVGENGTGYLVRLSLPGTGLYNTTIPEANYGGQLQDLSVSGVPTEGQISITYTEIPGMFPDGELFSLRQPMVSVTSFGYGSMDPSTLFSPRVAQQMVGLGLLETINESDILSHADEEDINSDGISGRPNYVWNFRTTSTELGRFGWKANQPDLYQQTCGAFLGDIGITSWLFPNENCTSVQLDCSGSPSGGTPEIETSDLEKVVLYCQTLAVPARRNWDNQHVLKGKQLFTQIGCANCHTPKFTTGVNSSIPSLSNQLIRPYTDLLLHDMGEGLSDNRPDFLATGNEWRTQPLWGLGLISTVNGHTQLLHDGRARSIKEAILWHGGEAHSSKNKFMALDAASRNYLIQFLESL